MATLELSHPTHSPQHQCSKSLATNIPPLKYHGAHDMDLQNITEIECHVSLSDVVIMMFHTGKEGCTSVGKGLVKIKILLLHCKWMLLLFNVKSVVNLTVLCLY